MTLAASNRAPSASIRQGSFSSWATNRRATCSTRMAPSRGYRGASPSFVSAPTEASPSYANTTFLSASCSGWPPSPCRRGAEQARGLRRSWFEHDSAAIGPARRAVCQLVLLVLLVHAPSRLLPSLLQCAQQQLRGLRARDRVTPP